MISIDNRLILTPVTMGRNIYNKKKSVYDPTILTSAVDGVSDEDFKNFNQNVLNNFTSEERKKYKDISERIKTATNSLEDYYAECVKLNTYATKDGYDTFINDKLATRVYNKKGISKTIEELQALRVAQKDAETDLTKAQTAFNTALSTTYKSEYEAGIATGMVKDDVVALLAANHQEAGGFKEINDNLNQASQNYTNASNSVEMYTTAVARNNQALGAFARQADTANLTMKQWQKQNGFISKAGNIVKSFGSMFLNGIASAGIGMLISLLISGIQTLVTAEADRRKAAIQAAEALQEENQTMEEQEERIKKLREELAAGTLSEEEAYNARKELIEIQDQLRESYGNEAEGIDLVNGGLEEQLGLLQNISKEKARDYISENAKAIEDARKKLSDNKTNSTSTLDLFKDGEKIAKSDEYYKATDALYNYIAKYTQTHDNISVTNKDDAYNSFTVAGSVNEMINMWESAYDYLADYGEKAGFDVSKALETISTQFLNELTEKYGEARNFLYDNVAPQEIVQDSSLSAYYKEIANAVEEYNEAVASGTSPDTAIDKIFALREKLLNDEVKDQYGENIEDEVLKYFADMFTKYLDSVNVSNFKSYIKKMSQTEKDKLSGAFDTMTDLDVKNMDNNTKATQEQLNAYRQLENYAEEYDISIDEAIDAMTSLGLITGDVANQAERTATAFEKMAEETSDTQTGLEKFNSAYNKALTNEPLTADEVNELLKLDPTLADKITQTADGYIIALNDLTKSRREYMTAAVSSQLDEVNALQTEINGYEDKIKEEQDKKDRFNKELAELSKEYAQQSSDFNKKGTAYVDVTYGPYRPGEEPQLNEAGKQLKEYYKLYTGYYKKLANGKIQLLNDGHDPDAHYVKDMRINTDTSIEEFKSDVSETTNRMNSLTAGIQNCSSRESEYAQKIKDANEELKQRNILIQQLIASASRDWKSDFNTVYDKYSAMDQRGRTAQQEMESQGFLSADTIKDIVDNTKDWSKCLTEVNGKMVFNAEKYREITEEESGYNQIIEDAEKYKDKLGNKVLALKALAKGYHVVYDESKSYLENLEAVRAAAAKTNAADSSVMKNLDNLEAEYLGLETSVDDCNSALFIFLQLLGQIAEENKIDKVLTDFEDKISEMNHKLNMGQITQDQYDSWYNSTWASNRSQLDYDSLNEASKDKYDQFDEEAYSQRISIQERAYEKEKTALDNLLEDKYISYKEYYDRLQALNEKYYGEGTLLGRTEDGKKTYESNARALADSAKNTYDDLMTRIDRAIDKNVIDDKLFAEIKAVFGNDIPSEVVNAINEAISSGKITYEQSAVFSKYLSEEIMGSIPALADDLQDAMDDIADRMKSEYDKQLQTLENEKTLGNIDAESYWKQRRALAEKYLKNNAALTEDWIDEEISYAIDAQKDMYEEATSLLERQLKNGEIAWSKYIDGLWDNWVKFYAGKKGLEEESNTALNGILDAEKEAAQEQISALEDEKDRLSEPYENQIQAIEDATEKMDKQYEDQINALQDKLDLLEKEEETNEKTLEIEEKKKALLDAQRDVYKSLRLVYDGNGNWVTKPTQESLDAVDEAQKALEEAEKEAADEKLKQKISDYIDGLQEEKDNFDAEQQKRIDALNQELADLQKPLDDLISILTLIAADQHNIDPEMLEKLLKSDAGKAAAERVNGKSADYQEVYNTVINSDLTDKALQAAVDTELRKALPAIDTSGMTQEQIENYRKRKTYFKDGVERMSVAEEKSIDPTTIESARAIADELVKGNKTVIQQLVDIGYDVDGYFKDYFKNLLGISTSDDTTSIVNKMIGYLNDASDSDKTSFYSILEAVGDSIFGDKWEKVNSVITDYKTAHTENVTTDVAANEESTTNNAAESTDKEAQLSELTTEQEAFTINLKKANEELEKFNQKMQNEFGLGNVDLTNRPKVAASDMQAAGYDVEDDSISTVFSSTDFIWQGDEENGKYVAIHYTPILPDGTVLDEKTLKDYIYGTLEGSNDVLKADSKGIILKVDTNFGITEEDMRSLETGIYTPHINAIIAACDEWDIALHDIQEAWMNLTNEINSVNPSPVSNVQNNSRYIPISEYSDQGGITNAIKDLMSMIDSPISASAILANLANKNNIGNATNKVINTGNTIAPVIKTNITVNASGNANEIAQAVGDVVDAKIVKSFQVFYDGYYNGSSKTMYGSN